MYRSFFWAFLGLVFSFLYIKNIYADETYSSETFKKGSIKVGRKPAVQELPAQIEVCGQTIPDPADLQKKLPAITAPMQKAAHFYPELDPSAFTRTNQCVAKDGDCEEKGKTEGGIEIKDGVPEIGNNFSETQMRAFHSSASAEYFENARDDSAFAVGHGYIRSSSKFFLLFRTQDNAKFHENAEGIDLVSAEALEQESKAQERLAEVIEEIKSRMQSDDEESLSALDHYALIASSQARALKLLACEFKSLADKNREIENRMSGIIKDFIEPGQERLLQTIAIKEQAMFGKKSNISGLEKEKELAIEIVQDQGLSRNLASEVIMKIDDPLAAFPIYDELRDNAENSAIWQGNSEDNLFGRVRQQHSSRYKKGEFTPTILDGN